MNPPTPTERPRLRKGLGQHLLVSDGVLDAVTVAATLSHDDLVVEVGPGTGLLTARLAAAAREVIAVELDPAMVAHLKTELAHVSNLTLVEGDVRDQNPATLTGNRPYVVVANLPYYTAVPAIRLFLESPHQPQRLIVMVQREVAQEITANPGRMGLLSLAIQVYADAVIVRRVHPGSFVPPPKVSSAILRLTVRETPLVPPTLIPRFFDVARAGFSAPRKQLRNALSNGLRVQAGAVNDWLNGAGIDPRRRAETLSIDEWRTLVEAPNAP